MTYDLRCCRADEGQPRHRMCSVGIQFDSKTYPVVEILMCAGYPVNKWYKIQDWSILGYQLQRVSNKINKTEITTLKTWVEK